MRFEYSNKLLYFFYLACNDTHLWKNGYNIPCSDYAFNVSNHWWCPNGTYTPATLRMGGNTFKYPEFNCCACGKGSSFDIQLVLS